MTKKRLQDDFYDYINHDWLQSTQIPSDRPNISAFGEMDLALEKLLKGLISDWATGKKEIPNNKHLQEMIILYKMVMDVETRTKLGWSVAKTDLDKILKLESFQDVAKQYVDLDYQFIGLPLGFYVSQDFINNRIKVLWMSQLGSILPSKENYDKEDKDKFLKVWSDMSFKLAKSYGLDDQTINHMIKKALEFDNLLKDYLLTNTQKADYVSLYNPKNIEWFADKSKLFPIKEIAEKLVENQKVDTIAIDNVVFFENLDKIFNDETFEGYKALLFFRNLQNTASYITEETREIATSFRKALYSIDQTRSLEDFAFDVVSKYFSMPIGLYYAQTYFGEQAKKNVENMVKNMIQIYEKRLKANNWLSKDTAEKAIVKLNKLGVMVGYPEEIESYYDKFIFKTYEQGGNLVSNLKIASQVLTKHNFDQYMQRTNDKLWSMSPAAINAYFHPFFNHIVFPAAILSAPFYDINASSGANYGGIGAVIAHEISHAFDNNGSQFDENGSLKNWWTEHDYKVFKDKTKAAIEIFDGIETEHGKVNGTLTVSENIADMGGFSCALEAAQKEPDFKAEDFFENWARIWRILSKPEAAKRRLESDVHAPGKQRANVQLSNCDLFYETYNITPSDGMYIEPSKRVKIW
ncbi:M13 family metallopeptidase [Mycoplasmopsis glycophila]|uniref:Neutral endopeptidase n=1 Tax=Mycoplasmopsis glycophila TaxID=171285 RepID=A0A449AUL4_9BACT|nr:M13 family metallopeptidase [Mycoplasmopsis glycophila]VEU70214.1 Neutral endopeptidase [Mycoplasmopsis glycophila]